MNSKCCVINKCRNHATHKFVFTVLSFLDCYSIDPDRKSFAHLGTRDANTSRCRTVVYCATHTVWPSGLCCVAQIPWLQHKLSQCLAREKSVGNFPQMWLVASRTWLCIYLKGQREASVRTSFRNGVVFLGGSHSMERICNLLCTACCAKVYTGFNECYTNTGCPATEEM